MFSIDGSVICPVCGESFSAEDMHDHMIACPHCAAVIKNQTPEGLDD